MLDTDTVAWSQPSTYSEGTGVHHGYSTAKATHWLTGVQLDLSKPLSTAWYAKLEPGGFIVPHIDEGPWVERWHYPISGKGLVWQEWDDPGPSQRLWDSEDGSAAWSYVPYRMNHHKPHAVWNPYDEPRIVLIVEYDNPVDQPTTDLILCDMIPEVQTMIDNI